MSPVLGRSHALSGVVAGLAVGSLVMHEHAGHLALLACLTADYALASDLDSCGSTEARSFGFATAVLAWCVRLVSGGHRHGTHSLLGVAAFTGVAWAACEFRGTWPGRAVLFVILAVGMAAAADALRPSAAHAENILALAIAAAMCWTGYGLALVPLAAALGTACHIAGDSCTVSGCPWLYPFSDRDFHLLPEPLRFTTGKFAESWIVSPLLLAALGFLLWKDAGVLFAAHASTALGG